MTLNSLSFIMIKQTNLFAAMAKTKYAAMAQQVEHVLGKDEVTGSSPVSSSIMTLPMFWECLIC